MKTSRVAVLIGVGALGIRHLEGLVKAKTPLTIHVIDKNAEALRAAGRVPAGVHRIMCVEELPALEHVDLAIIATTSAARAAAVRTLVSRAQKVRFLILEKILFDKKSDYAPIAKLLKKHRLKAWVNSPLPLFRFHRTLKKPGSPVAMHVIGGARYGLMTNITHYAHFAAFLAGGAPLSVDTSLLEPRVIESKRAGYLELTGTLVMKFKGGSKLVASTLPMDLPRRTIILAKNIRAEISEASGTAQVSKKSGRWRWQEVPAPFTRQSDMTGAIADTILKQGSCDLPTYEASSVVHLVIFEAVRKFLKKAGISTVVDYPFT